MADTVCCYRLTFMECTFKGFPQPCHKLTYEFQVRIKCKSLLKTKSYQSKFHLIRIYMMVLLFIKLSGCILLKSIFYSSNSYKSIWLPNNANGGDKFCLSLKPNSNFIFNIFLWRAVVFYFK